MTAERNLNVGVSVKEDVVNICGWPTDTVSIDYRNKDNEVIPAHTLILFVPGNPGCIGWYQKLLFQIIEKLGVGFAARGVSYAGHGIRNNITGAHDKLRENSIAWTVDGQVEHKIKWLDFLSVQERFRSGTNKHTKIPFARFVFLTHSIGSHLVNRLCLLRPDILQQTKLILHLMPFIRFDPPTLQKWYLSTVARSSDAAVQLLRTMSKFASLIPTNILDFCMKNFSNIPDEEDRKLAMGLVTQPSMATNFLTLGCEELRDIPETEDMAAMRIIGQKCQTCMLYCGAPDQWAPFSHIADIQDLQKKGSIPENISITYMKELLHAFIIYPNMIPSVLDFVIQSVQKNVTSADQPLPKTYIRSSL